MPYGIDKNQGGDTPSNDQWMEHCVNSILAKDKTTDKSKAIAICKVMLRKKKEKSSSTETTGITYHVEDFSHKD